MPEKLSSEQILAFHQHLKLTQKFCVAHLTEIPQGSQLSRILARICKEQKLNPVDQSYLARYELLAIADFALGQSSLEEFTKKMRQRSSDKKQTFAARLKEEKQAQLAEIEVKHRIAGGKKLQLNRAAEKERLAQRIAADRLIEKNRIAEQVKKDEAIKVAAQVSLELVQESKKTYLELIEKYGFADNKNTPLLGTRLLSILKRIESNQKLFDGDFECLTSKGFFALKRHALGEINLEEYRIAQPIETKQREAVIAAENERQRIEMKIAEEKRQVQLEIERQRIAAAKLAFDNDPINIAKAKQEKIKNKYGISGFIEKDCFTKLIDILNKIDANIRLTDEDIVWLETTAKQYYTYELRNAYHRIEAQFHHDEFSKTNDPWSAVNASAHYRKSAQSRAADTLLSSIDIDKKKDTKLKSAFSTTHGGVKRDLRLWNEALSLGEKAHLITPKNFRPCTLLGAVNMEIGNYDLGQSWYAKAVERGYTEKSVDDELKQIFKRADKIQKEALRAHLLKTDSQRYHWAKA